MSELVPVPLVSSWGMTHCCVFSLQQKSGLECMRPLPEFAWYSKPTTSQKCVGTSWAGVCNMLIMHHMPESYQEVKPQWHILQLTALYLHVTLSKFLYRTRVELESLFGNLMIPFESTVDCL